MFSCVEKEIQKTIHSLGKKKTFKTAIFQNLLDVA